MELHVQYNGVARTVLVGRAAEDLVQSRWVLGDRVFPRGPAPGALEHCRGPVRSAGVPLGALGTYRDV